MSMPHSPRIVMSLFWLLFVLASRSLPAAETTPENLLPQGEFAQVEAKDDRPLGWWINADNAPAIRLVTVDGARCLQIRNTQPDKALNLATTVKLKPEWERLQVEVQMRVTGLKPGKDKWHLARVGLGFLGSDGKVLKYAPSPQLATDSDWQTLNVTAEIPPQAVKLDLTPGLYYATGNLEIRSIRVLAQPDAELPEVKLPAGERLAWGEEPVETVSASRSQIILNGIWRFAPAVNAAVAEAPERGWGYIRVPGAYAAKSAMPGLVTRGAGRLWKKLDLDNLGRAWYQRELTVPAEWAGREIILQLDRVSTDAVVYIDGQTAGRVDWPFGELELTKLLNPGQKARLDILVLAVPTEGELKQYLDANHAVAKDAALRSRGLTGDVRLVSRPARTNIEGLFIQTSVRKKTLTVEIDVRNVPQPTEAELTALIRDAAGQTVKTFTGRIPLNRAASQTAVASWEWADPRLWDFKQPNLYTLALKLNAPGTLEDEYVQRFGFREFRIEGKQFLFNEKPFHLQPVLCFPEREIGAVKPAIANWIAGFIQNNFNLQELWPWDHWERGVYHYREYWAEAADEAGWPLMYPAVSMETFIKAWDDPRARTEWTERMLKEWKRMRNHPSIVITVCTANRFGHFDDQNPRRLGNSKLIEGDEKWQASARTGREALEIIRSFDPTRPLTSHHAAGVGDIHTCNHYLDYTPLQEREEWLSEWAQAGDKPYMAIEFGTPFCYNYLRGRNGAHLAPHSEPLTTEFCGIYLGAETYALERPEYRQEIVKKFISGQEYQRWQGTTNFRFAPAAMQLQELFIRNTWRSWRTYGLSGGMIAWENATGWTNQSGAVELPAWQPGQTGWYLPKMSKSTFYGFLPEGSQLTPAGQTLVTSQAPRLMWLAGPAADFTDKSHHFCGGEKLLKSAVLINDERTEQDYNLRWNVKLGDKALASGEKAGRLAVGQILFIPLEAALPSVEAKTRGQIAAEVDFGGTRLSDELAFTLYPALAPAGSEPVWLLDPSGETRAYLTQLGWSTRPWQGEAATPGAVLVIGQKALLTPAPGQPAEFARAGGTVICLGQEPDWLQSRSRLRVAAHVSRRFWPVASQAAHPLLTGLDAEDLRDWRGAGTLVPQTSATELEWAKPKPENGWHWGNRGSVSSAAIEKPHNTGWTPLLEGEFDLAYSPLMELGLGAGRVVLCTLDLVGRTEREPVAELLTQRLLAYARTPAAPRPTAPAAYLGGERGRTLLDQIGLEYQPAPALPNNGLLVIGEDANLSADQLRAFIERGGRAVLLTRDATAKGLGFQWETKTYTGAAAPDWPECRGLSASDLRPRVDLQIPLFTAGAEVGAGGWLGRFALGQGSAISCAACFDELEKDKKTYLRFTAWRWRRALCQVLANQGGQFKMNQTLLAWTKESAQFDPLPLAGEWRLKVETRLPPVASPEQAPADPGNTGFDLGYAAPDCDDSTWLKAEMPQPIENLGGELANFDGTFWLRREITVPAAWQGRELLLLLDAVDDCDVTYFNGKKIGEIDKRTPFFWQVLREYRVPAELIKAGGKNVIAVRVFDHFGSGGLMAPRNSLLLKLADNRELGVYDPDYRKDHALGDDPYRYHRW